MGDVVKTFKDIKKIGEWAKENKIQVIKVDGLEIVFSNYAMIDKETALDIDSLKPEEDNDDLLYHST